MEYYNRITIEFEDAEAAKRSENSVRSCLDNIDAKAFGYSDRVVFGDIYKENLIYDNNNTFSIDEEEECGFATPEDSLEIIPMMAKNIAEENKEIPFCISSFNTGTYSDSRVGIQYRDGKMAIETIYYPEGDYDNMLCCPECGEEIVSVNDYEKGKIYACNDCGEECDLKDEYEEARPVEEKRVLII